MSNPVAPVCSIEPVIKPNQPDPTKFPAVPQAVDLSSALRAINALAAIVANITGQVGTSSGGSNGSGGSKQFPPPRPGKPPPIGRWVQKTITRKNVTITNPKDPTQSIVVSRVENLTMVDSVTGETWVYAGTDG